VVPDLDHWLPDYAIRVVHRRESSAPADRLWEAARSVRLCDAALLGRLVRWRIPGTPAKISFEEMFRQPPFAILEGDREGALLAGIVGRIWTLRRDYPQLSEPDEFRRWSQRGTARVLLANWVQGTGEAGSTLVSESRVQAIGAQGRVGLAAVRPLVAGFQQLVGSDGVQAAVRRAERQ